VGGHLGQRRQPGPHSLGRVGEVDFEGCARTKACIQDYGPDFGLLIRAGGRGDILAIFAVALLTTLAVGITTAVRAELKAAHASLERMQDLFLAQAGVDVTRALLLYEDQTYDALDDPWGPYAEETLDAPQPLGAGYYRVRVYDACGRIDINHADLGTLLRMTEDPVLAEEIIRWRSGQADQDYYLSLPYPYPPRQGIFQSLGELLLVEGMTPDLFFGTEDRLGLANLVTVEAISPNTNARGEWRTLMRDLSLASGELPNFDSWFSQHHSELLEIADLETWRRIISYRAPGSSTGTYASLAQLADVLASYGALEALDYLTVTPDQYLLGRVNVNTASEEVLSLLPGSSPAIAKALVERRAEQPFISLGDLAQFLYSQEEGGSVLAQMIDHVTTKSSSFIIEAMGTMGAGGSFRTIRAHVRRMNDTVRVVRQFEENIPLPPYQEIVSTALRRQTIASL